MTWKLIGSTLLFWVVIGTLYRLRAFLWEETSLRSLSMGLGALVSPGCAGLFAARAVAYEWVALVESELHNLAHGPWSGASWIRGPKGIRDLPRTTAESLRTVRMVYDEPFPRIVELIENHFGVRFSDVEGWNEVRSLRDTVNALKHRRGFKHPREINWERKDPTLPMRRSYGQDDAVKAVSNVRRFFRGLRSALEPRDTSGANEGQGRQL